ncbi:MAG TPA: hypothetical protein VF796_24065 [Humisphaera sp.]
MFTALLHLADGFRLPRNAAAPARTPRPTMIENLEGRQLLSGSVAHAPAAALVAAPAAVTQPLASPGKLAQKGVTNVLPLQITSVVADLTKGTLTAVGKLGNTVFSVPITLQKAAGSTAATPILDLHLGAIHLDLLGLNVDTSEICLNIAAQPNGGLLGSLLSGVANLLNGGSTLGGILGGLSATNLATLTNGITNLLNGALGAATAPSAVTGVSSSPAAAATNTTDILNLSLGPVNLNLLGLTVKLDNCNNGPVTVDITAEAGQGKLLGNLLTGLSRLLDNGASNVAVANSLGRVTSAIGGLI